MIPVRLNISGFLSYLDPVSLDFTTFDVACISGSNGAGKSSLLDAMTWALFGQARRRDDAIINSHASAAEVVLELEYEGDAYRIQRIKPRGKSAILEFSQRAADGNWKPLTERSIRDTELRIQQILRMDYDTFINASFFLQGQADLFAQQRPGDRKRILGSILGLEVWETYRAATAEQRKRLETEQAGLDGQLAEIAAELAQEPERRARLRVLEQQLAQSQALRREKETALDALRRLADSLEEQRRRIEAQAAQLMTAWQRQAQQADQLEELVLERQQHTARLEHADEIRAAFQSWQDARAALERWDGVARNFQQYELRRSAPALVIETEKARLEHELRTLQAEERAVKDSSGRLPELAAELAEAQQLVAALAERMNQRPALEVELRGLDKAWVEAEAENKQLYLEMKEIERRINNLKAVEGAICPFCSQPLSAQDRAALVESLTLQGREKGDRHRQNKQSQRQSEMARAELDEQLSGFGALETSLRDLQVKTDRLENRQNEVQLLLANWEANGAVALQEVNVKLAKDDFALEARTELAKIDAALKELGYDAAAHDAVRREELAGRASEEQLRALETARAALAPLEREITRLDAQVSAAAGELEAQEADYRRIEQQYNADVANLPDLNQTERELFDLQEMENRLRLQVGGAQQAVNVLDGQRTRQTAINERRAEIARQTGQLKMLERAFGKDGVPALLIEQALPEIETLANEILDRLSDGNMSVKFATQRDYKDKKREDKQETLDIVISDAAGPREYELFSGGEAFRVNFAIRLALSRYLAQRAGARLQTLVIDEGFGSQDSDGRQRLIEAINQVRPNFAKILAITHMDELKDAFPVRVEVEKTPRGSRISVIS